MDSLIMIKSIIGERSAQCNVVFLSLF